MVNPDRVLWTAKQEVLHHAEGRLHADGKPKVMAYGDAVLQTAC